MSQCSDRTRISRSTFSRRDTHRRLLGGSFGSSGGAFLSGSGSLGCLCSGSGSGLIEEEALSSIPGGRGGDMHQM